MNEWHVYQNSRIRHGDDTLYMARDGGGKALFVHGEGEAFAALSGETIVLQGGCAKRCPLSNANADVIRQLFPFASPVRHKGKPFTMGLGDRLGVASAGHLRLLRERAGVFPVLAQHSIRELNLTGRTYEDVLAAAVWAVFQEGWKEGYGADGDHLKTEKEVKIALDCGFTMITLDCSEHIRPSESGDPAEVYDEAIQFAISIYDGLLRDKEVDFELSIDETETPTTPAAHRYVAEALKAANVELVSLAPRFCGEFQKGIDYRGDLAAFEKDLKEHVKIAKKMGYKLSIHSGSDKFSVFPAIFCETEGVVHLKTAGTNWLEALRVLAQSEPAVFREIVGFALTALPEAKKYYHITEDTGRIPDVGALKDKKLVKLLDQDDARQVLHVTYGQVLTTERFRKAIYEAMFAHEEAYYAALGERISRHLPTSEEECEEV
jgi:hypothetical protein